MTSEVFDCGQVIAVTSEVFDCCQVIAVTSEVLSDCSQVIAVTSEVFVSLLPFQMSGIVGSVLGLVGLVSEFCAQMRWQV